MLSTSCYFFLFTSALPRGSLSSDAPPFTAMVLSPKQGQGQGQGEAEVAWTTLLFLLSLS